MRIAKRVIKLPEGSFEADLQHFDESDRRTLSDIYKMWIALSRALNNVRGRSINLPEGLSEAAFALEMNSPRIVKCKGQVNTSFDCYCLDTSERIQVKACSVIPDLTSFGPKSVWDKLYFCDFYREGKWDGTFDIYYIPNKYIYGHSVNASQTFKRQQEEKRRPRFSLYKDAVVPYKLIPIKTGNLFKHA